LCFQYVDDAGLRVWSGEATEKGCKSASNSKKGFWDEDEKDDSKENYGRWKSKGGELRDKLSCTIVGKNAL